NGTEDEAAADDEVKGITDGEEKIKENGDGGLCNTRDDKNMNTLAVDDNIDGHSLESRSSCISPASSQGGVYSVTELVKQSIILCTTLSGLQNSHELLCN
ncbi:unnamed protein product, partial [Meganyctiphanes norvegica]